MKANISNSIFRIFRFAALVAAATASITNAATNRLTVGFAEYTLEGDALLVRDVADPARPLPVCHFSLDGFGNGHLSISNKTLFAEGSGHFATFDISDIFAPERLVSTNEPVADIPAVPAGELFLKPCGHDGIRIYKLDGGGRALGELMEITHCITSGPALDVAAIPGGFAVALGTRGYAIYDLDESGIVTLLRQWPLETGRAVSFSAMENGLFVDCQEGGLRPVSRP